MGNYAVKYLNRSQTWYKIVVIKKLTGCVSEVKPVLGAKWKSMYFKYELERISFWIEIHNNPPVDLLKSISLGYQW